jgi:hypothetical protein
VTPRWKRRKRHAASRARKLAAMLSVCAFVAIGQAINLAAPAVSTAHNGALVQSAGSHTSLLSASKRSATVSAAPRTTKAVTSTHAG